MYLCMMYHCMIYHDLSYIVVWYCVYSVIFVCIVYYCTVYCILLYCTLYITVLCMLVSNPLLKPILELIFKTPEFSRQWKIWSWNCYLWNMWWQLVLKFQVTFSERMTSFMEKNGWCENRYFTVERKMSKKKRKGVT